MPASLPTSVRRAIGEEASEDLAAHLDAQTASRDQHREVLTRMDGLKERMNNPSCVLVSQSILDGGRPTADRSFRIPAWL